MPTPRTAPGRRTPLEHVFECGGPRSKQSKDTHYGSEAGSDVGSLGGLYAKVDKLQVIVERQSLITRNVDKRAQESVEYLTRLESKFEQLLSAVTGSGFPRLGEPGGQPHKDAGPIPDSDGQATASTATPAEAALPREAAPSGGEVAAPLKALEAVEQKYSSIESQLTLVQLEIARLGSTNHQMEQSFMDHQSKLDAAQHKLDAHQSKLDANYQAISATLTELKSAPPAPKLAASIATSPFPTPRVNELSQAALLEAQMETIQAEQDYQALALQPSAYQVQTLTGEDMEAEPTMAPSQEPQSPSKQRMVATTKTDLDDYEAAMGWRHSVMSSEMLHIPAWDVITKIGQSAGFNMICAFMIVVNIALMGAESNLKVTALLDRTTGVINPQTPYDAQVMLFLKVMDWIFLVWMTIELFFNVWVMRANKYADWKWNVFDAIILCTSAFQLIMNTTSLSVLRMGKLYKLIRVLRVGKVLKVLRVFRFLNGVRKMVLSVLGSLTSLFWAFFLMSMIMYVVAIIFLQGIEGYLDTELEKIRSGETDFQFPVNGTAMDTMSPLYSFYQLPDEGHTEMLRKWYGGVGITMLTLFRAISGGAEWAEVSEPVAEISFLYLGLWIGFMAFMIFGVLNILTGVFCDAAMKAANDDREMMMQEMIAEQESSANALKKFFTEADTDNSGYVSREEFMEILEHQEVEVQLAQLGITRSEAKGLFSLLDDDESGEVGIEEFITGALRLKGGAKAVDMVTLLFENKKMKKSIIGINQNVVSIMDKVGCHSAIRLSKI